ncbi:MAG: Mth938-like domain-containing protein [Thermoplasmatota archaeon]
MFKDPKGPIESFSWARFVVHGEEHSRTKGVGKDVLIRGSDVKEWKDMGGHQLTPHSLDCLKGYDIDVLVIGDGVHGAVVVSDDVKEEARSMGIKELIVEHTPKACGTYNGSIREGKKALLLAHGTC